MIPKLTDVTDSSELLKVEQMFYALYEHFREISGRSYLREDSAFEAWSAGYSQGALKSRLVCIAAADGMPVGFAEGSLRVPPAYYEPGVLGLINHLYVVPQQRGKGLAGQLVRRLQGWFESRRVRTVQLHVVRGNQDAVDFWAGRGFETELMQMRSKHG
jgi:GNAT superfamily N-acetyltransferase